ncbi:MAG: hypothetical protein ABJB76_00125 [Candidatus Nitrosocosmicus sp.]
MSYKQECKPKQNESEYDLIVRKADSIPKTCTKAHFNTILKNPAKENLENAK